MTNENKIRLSGIANLSQEPKRTNVFVDLSIKSATLTGDIDIRSNEDETEDKIYKLKITPETEITILCENEIINAKKKGSQSQALRLVIMKFWEQQHSADFEFEDFYKLEMINLIDKYNQKLI